MQKKFHRYIEKINNSINPLTIAKNYLKIYRGFRKEFEGWFISFSDSIIHACEPILLCQHVIYLLKAQQRDENIIYELMDKKKYGAYFPNLETYFGITNYEKDFTMHDVISE